MNECDGKLNDSILKNKMKIQWFDYKMAVFLAVLSGLFSVLVSLSLLWSAVSYPTMVYFDDEDFLSLKEELRQHPDDPVLVESFRAEDLLRRQNYDRSRNRLKFGGYLLFGGLLVFVVSIRRMDALTEPVPQPLDPDDLTIQSRTRILTFISMLAIPLPILILIYISIGAGLSEKQGQEVSESGQLPGAIDLLEKGPIPIERTWPGLRGPSGLGVIEAMDLPLAWDSESEWNVLWKSPIPLAGNSTPVVWGNRLFLTGADQDHRKVFCYHTQDGKLLWTCTIVTPARLKVDLEDQADTGFASPTAVTDGKFLVAFFGTCELAGIDFSGKQVWSRWFGEPNSLYGVATSLAYFQGKVILQLDQGIGDEKQSFLYAIDPLNGNILWKTPRDVPGSWSSPIIVETTGRHEIITAASPWVISYDPDTGKEWWRAKALSGDVAPVPAYSDGLAFTVTEYSQLSAIRTGGSGDVTESHIEWTYDEDLPDVASPVTDGKLLLLPTGYGTVHCFNARNGEILWTQEFDEGFWSSPVLVGENIYITDKDGITWIFKLAETYQFLGKGNVGETVFTTPAFADSKLYIRGQEHLFCIGKKS